MDQPRRTTFLRCPAIQRAQDAHRSLCTWPHDFPLQHAGAGNAVNTGMEQHIATPPPNEAIADYIDDLFDEVFATRIDNLIREYYADVMECQAGLKSLTERLSNLEWVVLRHLARATERDIG